MVVDEAGMLDAATRAILSTRRSATLGPIRYIGNPGPVLGEFWNLCQQAQDEDNAGRFAFVKWTWRDRYLALKGEHPEGDTPATLKDVERAVAYHAFIESEKKDLAPFEFEQAYEAKFATPPTAIFAPWLDDAMTLDADPNPHPGHEYVAGWDVGQVNDWTRGAFLCLTCWHVHHVASIRRVGYPAIEEFIASESARFKAKAVIEKNGPGGPSIDHVREKYRLTESWWTDSTSKRTAVLTVNRLGSSGQLRLANLPVLRSEMTTFESHQSPTSGAWTFGAVKGAHDDAVMALVIAVGSATSGGTGYIQMLKRQIEKAEQAKRDAAEKKP